MGIINSDNYCEIYSLTFHQWVAGSIPAARTNLFNDLRAMHARSIFQKVTFGHMHFHYALIFEEVPTGSNQWVPLVVLLLREPRMEAVPQKFDFRDYVSQKLFKVWVTLG